MNGDILKGLGSLSAKANQNRKKQNAIQQSTGKNVGDIFSIPLDSIVVEEQVRKDFRGIKELALQIASEGQRMPLEVSKLPNDKYLLITGERRYRALSSNEADNALVILVEMPADKKERIALQLTENLQREDLTPLEIAASLSALVENGLEQKQIALAIGKNKSWVSRYITLHKADPAVKKLVHDGITTDIYLSDILNKIFRLSEDEFYRLEKSLRAGELTRNLAASKLEELQAKQEDEEKPDSEPVDEVKSKEKDSEIRAYHYNRKTVEIKPAAFKANVKARLTNGDRVTGKLCLDALVDGAEESMVWIETEDGKVAVEARTIRLVSLGG